MGECVDTGVSTVNEWGNSRENHADDTVVNSDLIGELQTLQDDLMPGKADVESYIPEKVAETQPFKVLGAFEMEVIIGSNATWMSKFLPETSIWDTWCLCCDRLIYRTEQNIFFINNTTRIYIRWLQNILIYPWEILTFKPNYITSRESTHTNTIK